MKKRNKWLLAGLCAVTAAVCTAAAGIAPVEKAAVNAETLENEEVVCDIEHEAVDMRIADLEKRIVVIEQAHENMRIAMNQPADAVAHGFFIKRFHRPRILPHELNNEEQQNIIEQPSMSPVGTVSGEEVSDANLSL